jgi:hypothetical protein
MAYEAGRAVVSTLQKHGAHCAVHFVAANTLGDAAGMERKACAADREHYSDKDKA